MPRPQPLAQRGKVGPGWGGGELGSLGTGIDRGFPELLLELKACLPVELKQLLEAGMDVVFLLLQVVQTAVDLVQHGDGSNIFCFPEAVILASHARLCWHAQVPIGARY